MHILYPALQEHLKTHNPSVVWVDTAVTFVADTVREELLYSLQKKHLETQIVHRLYPDDLQKNEPFPAVGQPSLFHEKIRIEISVDHTTILSASFLKNLDALHPWPSWLSALWIFYRSYEKKKAYTTLRSWVEQQKGTMLTLDTQSQNAQKFWLQKAAQHYTLTIPSQSLTLLMDHHTLPRALECLQQIALYLPAPAILSVSVLKTFLSTKTQISVQHIIRTLNHRKQEELHSLLGLLREEDYPLPLVIWGFLEFFKKGQPSPQHIALLSSADAYAKHNQKVLASHCLHSLGLSLLEPHFNAQSLMSPDD
jgi:hypothetical protein